MLRFAPYCTAPATRLRLKQSWWKMDDLIRTFTERGDLAHLALFLWASLASALAILALRELAAAARRFDDFVRELSRFNNRLRRRASGGK